MTKYIVILFCLSLCIVSCKKEHFKRVFISENKTEVSIDGEKEGLAMEWSVTIKVKANGFNDGALSFQIYNDSLENNVKIDWLNPENAIITFIEKDRERKFKLIASDKQVFLAEMN
jgi:hypothetical protein